MHAMKNLHLKQEHSMTSYWY